jgi:hypothetical protein
MKNKGLWLDVIISLIIIGALVLALFAFKSPKAPEGQPVILTLNVTRNADLIYDEASKLGAVYFNSVETPVKVVSVSKTTRNNLPALEVALESKGEIDNGKIIFDGIRVLVGQKAELHSTYFAQGVIQNVQYKK